MDLDDLRTACRALGAASVAMCGEDLASLSGAILQEAAMVDIEGTKAALEGAAGFRAEHLEVDEQTVHLVLDPSLPSGSWLVVRSAE